MDYADMSKAVNPLIDALDHRHLGTFDHKFGEWRPVIPEYPKEIYPSSEVLTSWIGHYLIGRNFPWSALALEETCTSYAYLARRDHATEKGGMNVALIDQK